MTLGYLGHLGYQVGQVRLRGRALRALRGKARTGSAFDLSFHVPDNDLIDPTPPALTRRPELWERAYAAVAAGQPQESEVFIHRDYHPGNTLWHDSKLTGIVDWTTASVGSARVDLGHMRWNLVVSYGEPVADQYLACYRELSDSTVPAEPYWDLRTVVDLMPDDGLELDVLARLEPYLERLLSTLS